MRADSGFGRIIGALIRSRVTLPPPAPPHYGIQRSSTGGRIIEALARAHPLHGETLTDSPVAVPQYNGQRNQFISLGEDIADFTIPDIRRARRDRQDNRRDQTRLLPFILASTVTAALVVAAHLSPLFAAQHGLRWNAPTSAPRPAPFSFIGYGFDSCYPPPTAMMQRWRQSSPYRAIFIYAGGKNSGCSPWSPSWVKSAQKLGWTVFPVYVGPQAPSWQGNGSKINPKLAFKEGEDDALGALKDTRHLGILPNVPIFGDMEGSPFSGATGAASLNAVRKYISGWDSVLKRAHAYSGFYTTCGNDSAIFANPDKVISPDVLTGAAWNGQANISPACERLSQSPWENAHAKQYLGNVTRSFGGIALFINIYSIDIRLGDPASARREAP